MKYIQSLNFDWIEILNFYERPFRAKFIPSKIWSELDNYKNDPEGLVNYVKKWRTKIFWKKETSKSKVYETYIAIGGEYDPEKTQSTLFICTDNYKHFHFTKDSWDKFKYRLIQTLMHEIIHCSQFVKRGGEWSNYVVPYKKVGKVKVDQERRYYSEFDEIQAYAHCVYLDLKVNKPTIDISVLLNRCKKYRDSKTLHFYLKAFDYDFKNNFAPKKILQHVAKWDRKYSRYTA
jgi:hypothetical protein